MPVFKPNASTQRAIDHPGKYSVTVGVVVTVLIGLGGILGGGFPATLWVGALVGIAVGLANYRGC